MPRQLPWMNKAAHSRTRVKQPPAKKQRVASDFDDDFFDGTVLASSKGKQQAADSDDDLPDLPAEPSTPRTKTRTKDALHKKRAESSSPPPIADLEKPRVEFMHEGVSKFDLRDDEWMMVEDEFLETAKLFTRHLHIAEYEKLKETIEEKKKEVDIMRPVIAEAKMSSEGAMKEKAKALEKKQKKAIQDVFALQDNEEGEEMMSSRASFGRSTSSFTSAKRTACSLPKRSPTSRAARESDSEDLDAIKSAPRTTKKTSLSSMRHTAASSKFASPHLTNTEIATPFTATKPSTTSRLNRETPFDMLDDYTPRKSQSIPKPSADPLAPRASYISKSSPLSSSPVKSPLVPSVTPKSSKLGRSVDLSDDWGGNGLGKETANRLAKKKADREQEKKDQERTERTSIKSDEIPTFLF